MAHLCLTSCSWAALCSSTLSWPRVACSFSLPPSSCCCNCALRPRSCWFCCRTLDCSQLSCWILDSSFRRANRHALFSIPHATSLRGGPQGSALGLLLFNVHALPPGDRNTCTLLCFEGIGGCSDTHLFLPGQHVLQLLLAVLQLLLQFHDLLLSPAFLEFTVNRPSV